MPIQKIVRAKRPENTEIEECEKTEINRLNNAQAQIILIRNRRGIILGMPVSSLRNFLTAKR